MQACVIIADDQAILLNMKKRFEIHKIFMEIHNFFIFTAPTHTFFFFFFLIFFILLDLFFVISPIHLEINLVLPKI